MARHRGFTRKKFFDALPDDLAIGYFASHRLSATKPLDEKQIDTLLLGAADVKRTTIEEELHVINDVADRAMDYLDRAYQQFDLELDENWTREWAAMHLFLKSPEAFRVAYDLYLWRATANTMSHVRLPEATADFGGPNLAALKNTAASYFQKHAMGGACNMRYYEEDGVHLMLIARGKYMQTQQVFADGNVRTDFYRPASEDVLVYDPQTGVLSMRVSTKKSDESKMYAEAFGTNVLGLTTSELALSSNIVTLVPIKNGRFKYGGNESIASVKLTEVQVRVQGVTDVRMRIASADVVRTLKTDLTTIKLENCELLSAKLKFRLAEGASTARPLTVEIRPPDRTVLNKRRDAEVIEGYLRENGVLLA